MFLNVRFTQLHSFIFKTMNFPERFRFDQSFGIAFIIIYLRTTLYKNIERQSCDVYCTLSVIHFIKMIFEFCFSYSCSHHNKLIHKI